MIKTTRSNDILSYRRVYAGIDTNRFNQVYATQQSANACWAACLEMVSKYYGLRISQNEFLKKHCGLDYFGRTCDCAAETTVITKNLNGCTSTHCLRTPVNYGKPSVKTLFNLLQKNKPVVIGYSQGAGNVGHAVIVTAISYEETIFGNKLYSITVRDPWPQGRTKNGLIEYSNPTDLLNRIYAWWVPSVIQKPIYWNNFQYWNQRGMDRY